MTAPARLAARELEPEDVTCPSCWAAPGEHCYKGRHRDNWRRPHVARVRAAAGGETVMPIPRGHPAHRYIATGPLPAEDYGSAGIGWTCYHCGEEKHVWRDLGRWWVGYGPEEYPHPSPCHKKRCDCLRAAREEEK